MNIRLPVALLLMQSLAWRLTKVVLQQDNFAKFFANEISRKGYFGFEVKGDHLLILVVYTILLLSSVLKKKVSK